MHDSRRIKRCEEYKIYIIGRHDDTFLKGRE